MVNYKLPKGIQDCLIKESFAKYTVMEKIRKCFYSCGYDEIQPPTIEYLDLFTDGIGGVSVKELFKFSDFDGSLLALRSDFTLPISRIVGTKLDGAIPKKFCYFGNCFDFTQKEYSYREFTQAGVELIGSDSVYADFEVLALAIDSLKSAGLNDFQIDIGNVGFVKGLLKDLKLKKDKIEEIISLIDKKNMLGLEQIAKEQNIPNKYYKILSELPLSFGDKEVLSAMRKAAINDESKASIERLIAISELLDSNGYSEYVTYDLSLVNSISYYSGIVFKGISKNFGSPLLSGGRYDKLISGFGKDLPAVGFAIGIKHLLVALDFEGTIPVKNECAYFIGFDKNSAEKAYKLINEYRKKGIAVNNMFEKSLKDIKVLKEQNPNGKFIFINSQGVSEEL